MVHIVKQTFEIAMFSAVSEVCTLAAALLMLSGSSFQSRATETQKSLSPNLFVAVCGSCINFLVFNIRVLVGLSE